MESELGKVHEFLYRAEGVGAQNFNVAVATLLAVWLVTWASMWRGGVTSGYCHPRARRFQGTGK